MFSQGPEANLINARLMGVKKKNMPTHQPTNPADAAVCCAVNWPVSGQ